MSDEELIQRIRNGETALFELVMRRYNQRIYRAVRAILHDDAETEDVMQQSYLNAYLHLDQFAGRAKFSTWLTRIAIYEALARARRAGRQLSLGENVEDELHGVAPMATNPEHQIFTAELHALLDAAVLALPTAYRVVFVLREIEGLSTAETADCLEIRQETVKTRLLRARAWLRRYLSTKFGVDNASALQFHAPRCDRVVANVMGNLAAANNAANPRAPVG